MQRQRRRRPDARRDEILDAAARLLAGASPAALNMDEVAAAAGTAKGTIYNYFSSRAELLAAVRESYATSLAALARDVLLEGEEAPARRWSRFAEIMLDFSLANQPLHHALFQGEAMTEDRSMEPLRDVVRAFLDRQIQEGTLAVPRAEVLLRVLLDGFHGALAAVAHEPGQREDFVAVARLMGEALVAPRRVL